MFTSDSIELRHLRLMRALAERGSLSRASQQLHLTPSALSHQLRDAEARVGAPLFHRLGRRMLPTPAGERLLRAAGAVLGELDEAGRELGRMAAGEIGRLRLAVECITAFHWLPAQMRRLRRRHPGVEVELVVDATRDPVAQLLAGRLDLAVACDCGPDPRLAARPLFRDDVVGLVAPDAPLAGKRWLEAADFADAHVILYALPVESSLLYQRLLTPAGVRPARVSQLPLTEAIVAMVREGQGMAALPRWAVTPWLASGEVVARPLTRRGLFRSWSGIWLRGAETPWLRSFLDQLARLPLAGARRRRSGSRRAEARAR